MPKCLQDWIADDVAPFKERSLEWLSTQHFFRDPARATFSDTSLFFSPADGIVLYQKVVDPDEPILEIKGRPYALRDALRDEAYDRRSLVIGIFMTFYDVHINRIPYPGRLSYRLLPPIDTLNHPMLEMENAILEDLRLPPTDVEYLHHNQRVVNRIDSPHLGDPYYVLQIADYDVNRITPFELRQNRAHQQGRRFSQIRYGSQTDLIVPVSPAYELACLQQTGTHVEAGIDPLIRIRGRTQNNQEDS